LQICNRILQNTSNYLNISVSAGISQIGCGISDIRNCYIQADFALNGKFYFGKNRVIHISEMDNYKSEPRDIVGKHEDELMQSIQINAETIEESIGRIFNYLKEQNISPQYIRNLSFELLAFVNKVVKKNYLGYEDIFNSKSLPYQYVMNLETLQDIREWFLNICIKISKKINDWLGHLLQLHFTIRIVSGMMAKSKRTQYRQSIPHGR
jgi:two-component system, response regulator YesN